MKESYNQRIHRAVTGAIIRVRVGGGQIELILTAVYGWSSEVRRSLKTSICW